jgi:Phage integrase, N-terminal SAM-like domain
MARKAGQLSRADRAPGSFAFTFGRDPQTKRREYHNQTIHGPFREAQRFLNLKLQQRENGRVSRAAVMSLNQLLDQWLTTVVKARVRTKSFKDYETLLRLHIRPVLSARPIGTISQIDMQYLYAQMFERGLSARTIEHTNCPEASAGSITVYRPTNTTPPKTVV